MNATRPPWLRFLLALAVGTTWALSFPLPGIAGLAWAAPGLLLVVTAAIPYGLAFRVAYMAGLAHYLISLSWLRHIPFPAGAYAGWICLSLFLALLPACWVVACWRLAQVLGLFPNSPPTSASNPAPSWNPLADLLIKTSWARLNAWFVLCAAAWVTSEMFIARFCGGFPWNLLGASQHRMLPLIQLASFTGVYGVSFLVVWFSISLVTAVSFLARDPDRPAIWRRPLVFPALMIVAATAGGFLAILADPKQPRRLNVALIQPSIPQTVIFDPNATTNRFEALLRLTEQALISKPDLVLWPEASLPGGLSRDDFNRLTARIREARVWMIFGADDVEDIPDPSGAGPGITRAYNSAFLVNPDGEVVASYRKRRLVMFGEYIPLVRWFPFLKQIAPIGDGFHPGTKPVPFRMDSLGVTTSSLICFEDNFPQEGREHAAADIDFLVNLTNNAWFGESAAQWQHAANAIFRAIETGVPLIRSCNNGISCWIDPRGRVYSARLADGRNVYEAGFEIVSVAFGTRRSPLYLRIGDTFGWTCVAATLLVFRRPRNSKTTESAIKQVPSADPGSASNPNGIA